jgi:demethylmenaquinone methyltransferase/2-methoxy-6-polyprenyl-1,4-benzoquinol methylase
VIATPPAKESARIAGMFDAIAARYDLLNHLLSAGLDRQWRRRAIAALRLSGREVLLDLCTGTGDLALAATDSTEPSRHARRVIGIDFSGEMLRIAQRKAGARAIDLLRGDATRIPLAASSVDAVTIGFGIRNVERPLEACREIARVLRPDGTLVILEFSLPRSAMLRSFYLSYFRRVLPIIGRVISRHKTAYSYLPESVEAFPSPEEFSRQLRESGFGTVNAVPLTFGVVYMFVAVKGQRPAE